MVTGGAGIQYIPLARSAKRLNATVCMTWPPQPSDLSVDFIGASTKYRIYPQGYSNDSWLQVRALPSSSGIYGAAGWLRDHVWHVIWRA